MSQENVEIVRRIYEEITASREFPPRCFDPACEVDFTDVAPDGSVHRGVEAANAAIAPYFAMFANFHVAVERIVHADDERVVAAIRDGGLLRESPREITSRYFHAWTFRDGKVVRLSSHTDEAAALGALGLTGQAMSPESVEVAKRTFAAMQRGDYATAGSNFHPDAVWQNTGDFPGPLRCVGPDAIIDFWVNLREPFDDRMSGGEIERSAVRGDVVVVGLHSVGRGRGSEVPIDVRWAAAVRVLDGRISRVDVYGSWEKAIEAVGLEE